MSESAKLVVFLGSGASSPFDKPVTKKLREDLLERYGSSKDSFLRAMMGFDLFIDFEELLTAAYEIRDFLSESRGGAFFKYFGSTPDPRLFILRGGNYLPSNNYLKEWSDVAETLEIEVYNHYRWNHQYTQLARDTYVKFLSYHFQQFNRIFIGTTNYDRAIENAVTDSDYRAVDGFEPVGDEYRWTGKFFHPESVKGKTDVVLCKLHGSLGWKRRKHDDIVVRTATESPVSEKTDSNYKNNVIIYPTLSTKHQHNDSLLNGIIEEFNSQLEDSTVCIIIGFSFRDDYLNKYFLEFERKGKPVIVILPAESINDAISNFIPQEKFEYYSDIKQYLKLPSHNIYFIPEYFQLENIDTINRTVSAILQTFTEERNKMKTMIKAANELAKATRGEE